MVAAAARGPAGESAGWRAIAVAPFRGLWSLAVLIVLWDLYVRAHGFNVIVLPDPLTVAKAIAGDWRTYDRSRKSTA